MTLIVGWGAARAVGGEGPLRAEAGNVLGTLAAVSDAGLEAPDVQLGRALFWDRRVSADGQTACASCHPAAD